MSSQNYLVKIPALLLVMVGEYCAIWPPQNPPPDKVEGKAFGEQDFITRVARWGPQITVTVLWTSHIAEITALLARAHPTSPLSPPLLAALFPNASAARADRLAPTPIFLVGLTLVSAGGAARRACFSALGRFFTYELGVLKGHRLVTRGPYAVVRHPAYTAFIVAVAGILCAQLGPGSYVSESGWLERGWVSATVWVWVTWLVVVALVAVRRTAKEDAVLRQEFGAEWEAWARKTPYKLIPYIY